MSETTTTATQTPTPTTPAQSADDVQALKRELEVLRKEKLDWSSKEDTLNDKVKREREEQDQKQSSSKSLESALTFNLTSNDFLKANESVLPKEMADIFNAANKEKYDSAIDKANATKAALIHSFFSQQSNLDLLTHSQKSDLADFQKLTKNGREEKSGEVYKNLFEPALESLKRVKKAEELARSSQGFGGSTSTEQAYKDKLMKMAEKKFFRGKNGA